MRFIAAALVFSSHVIPGLMMFATPEATREYSTIFSRAGFAGVGFFFVLSGFVLAWSARSSDTAPRFWRRRIVKIYPNHIVTFVAALLLVTIVSNQVVDKRYLAINVLLLHSWFPSMDVIVVNPVAWSLSCELLFYLSFPLLIRAIWRIRPERLWRWAGGVVALVLLVPLGAMALPDSPPSPFVQVVAPNELWLLFMFPPVRMLDFVLGIILARIVITTRRAPLSLGGATALAIGTYALTPMLPSTYQVVAPMVLPLGLVIAAGAVADLERRPTWLATKGMVTLGEISFAFYMVHFTVLVYGFRWFAMDGQFGQRTGWGLVAALFAVSIALAWVLYTTVEAPMVRRFSRARRRPTTPATTPPAPPDLPVERTPSPV